MSVKVWGSVPYLDALRPEPGWRTDFAFLATYSADLVAVVAALLALAGLDDERGSGSKVDFANSIESLRNRVGILVQAGRVTAPSRSPKILTILDRFVRVQAMNEAVGSWHPKVALLRLVAEDGVATQWRLWLGSRNLSRDTSWDVGLALAGKESGEGLPIPGVAKLGRELAARSGLPAISGRSVAAELSRVHWSMPPGCEVKEVRLLMGDNRPFPRPPEGIRRMTVVSPFLDGTMANELGQWGGDGTERVLLSTLTELGRLAKQKATPLARYSQLLHLDAPAPEADGMEPGDDDQSVDSEDEEFEQRGLHAKIIYVEHAAGRTLWVGSANATSRGWRGPNVEVVAKIEIDSQLDEGLESFIKEIAQTADLGSLPEFKEDPIEKRLETARHQVASRWQVVQKSFHGAPEFGCSQPPHPDDLEVHLDVGLLGQPLQGWPRLALSLEIPSVPVAEQTELVRCRLRLGQANISWIQCAPMDPRPSDDRDRRALARFLDPRTFLLWIRSLLTDDSLGAGGGDWDAERGWSRDLLSESAPDWWAPTLEEVLRAWARNPATLAEVDRKVRSYLHVMTEERCDELTKEETTALTDFQRTWDILRRELVDHGP